MKKLIITIGILACMAVFCGADTLQEDLRARLEKLLVQVQYPSNNSGSINKNTVVSFRVQDFYGTRASEKMPLNCKAYPVAPHWLLVAGTCAKAQQGYTAGGLVLTVTQHLLTPDEPGVSFSHNERVMLVWSDRYNFTGPFVNILATQSAKQLFTLSAFNAVKINTARWGKNAIKTRHLKAGSVTANAENKTLFRLRETISDLSGTATDPLFLIGRESPHNEFLAAYNNGVLNYVQYPRYLAGEPSRDWYNLQRDDLDFIKNTVLKNRPADWAQIKTRLFYNDIKTPYFD